MLRIIDHTPSINATDYPRNGKVIVKFNKVLNVSSLSYNTFSVQDHESMTTVPGEAVVKYTKDPSDPYGTGIPDTIEFTPTLNYQPNKKIKVYVFGSPSSVYSTDNETLDDSYIFEFTTGSTTSLSSVEAESLNISPILLSANYDSINNSLLLNFNTNVSNLNTNLSGIKLFTISDQSPNVSEIVVPFSGYLKNNYAIISTVTSSTLIDNLPHKDITFNISIPSGLVSDYTGTYFNDSKLLYGVQYNGINNDLVLNEVNEEDLVVVETKPYHLESNYKNFKNIVVKFNRPIDYNTSSIYNFIRITSKNVLD